VKYFQDYSRSTVDYAKLMQKHPDALIAGSPYPDAYYDTICDSGKYHDVSEDTHWAPFLKTAVDYIRLKYPQPWDVATEKLVVFMFGIVSHQVADIVWHSLGIDQGFLRTMGDINFHGSFDLAHSAGDLGGDVLTAYEMNLTYVPLVQGWYIPTDDLFNIYTQYYNTTDKMPKDIIVMCTSILYLARLGEHLALKEIFRKTAKESPFLVDQFERYFLGGVDDMAGWTDRIWHETITMFERGSDHCLVPKSTLFLQCNASNYRMDGYRDPGKNGYYTRPPMHGVSREDFTVEKELRGVRVKPTPAFLEKLKKSLTKPKKSIEKPVGAPFKTPNKVLYVKQDYSRLGEQYASGDLNSDGYEDLVITAPGYSRMGSPQEGRVYIIHGTKDGIAASVNPDLDDLEITRQGQIMKGWGTAQARFGTSVAVLDINLDGTDDLAIGGPAFVEAGANPLQYNGYVLIYFGIPSKHMVANGAANITIGCDKIRYCNLGYSMTTADVNFDGYPDLVFGSPFAPAGGEQRGFVSAVTANKSNTGYQYYDVSQLPWHEEGFSDYGWFGYNMGSSKLFDEPVLFVTHAEYRLCKLDNCTYDQGDKQAVGQYSAFSKTEQMDDWGSADFSQYGWDIDVGTPYPDKGRLMVAVSELGSTVKGKLFGLPSDFEQAGQVLLLNATTWKDIDEKSSYQLQGDRAYGRFGAKVKFLDINGDGLSDLLIGAPFRSEDFTEELSEGEEGHVYIYLGGEHFPFDQSKADCGNSIVHPCPQYQASMVLTWTDDKPNQRFGSNFFSVKSANKTELFVTAQHSSDYARSAGAVGVFFMG